MNTPTGIAVTSWSPDSANPDSEFRAFASVGAAEEDKSRGENGVLDVFKVSTRNGSRVRTVYRLRATGKRKSDVLILDRFDLIAASERLITVGTFEIASSSLPP
jgi:hypothetical protein